jgi:hypothetical protein
MTGCESLSAPFNVDNLCFPFACAICMGKMKRQISSENGRVARYAGTVAICASIVAAVSLARDEVTGLSPTLAWAVADSVRLALVSEEGARR